MDTQFVQTFPYKAKSCESYVKEKIKMLERDFKVQLTDEQKAHMYNLKTEVQVDNYSIKLMMDNL